MSVNFTKKTDLIEYHLKSITPIFQYSITPIVEQSGANFKYMHFFP